MVDCKLLVKHGSMLIKHVRFWGPNPNPSTLPAATLTHMQSVHATFRQIRGTNPISPTHAQLQPLGATNTRPHACTRQQGSAMPQTAAASGGKQAVLVLTTHTTASSRLTHKLQIRRGRGPPGVIWAERADTVAARAAATGWGLAGIRVIFSSCPCATESTARSSTSATQRAVSIGARAPSILKLRLLGK